MYRKPLAKDTKEKMAKLLDLDFVAEILNKRLNKYYSDFAEVKKIKATPFKKHLGVTSAVFVVEYVIDYFDIHKNKKQLVVFASAHSDYSRKDAYKKTSFLYNNGFDQGKFRVTKPLFYINEQRAFFYEASVGKNFFSFLREDEEANFKGVFTLVAGWIKQLHSFDIEKNPVDWRHFSISTMNPAPKKFIKDFLEEDKICGKIVSELVETMIKMEEDNANKNKQTMIYGDNHPENVIIESLQARHLEMIDFTDLALGDPMADIGTFLQQFDFMSHTFMPREKINKYKLYFLEAYFGKKIDKINVDYINRINLYQSWTALRTTVFVFYMHNEESDILDLLEEAKNYLDLAVDSKREINLH